MAATSQRSLTVDFEDLITFDEELARNLVERPDELLEYTNRAVWTQMKVEDPEYAESVKRFFARFRGLPEKFPLRKLSSDQVGKLLAVDGIIVRSTPVKPLLVRATFQCRQCSAIVYLDQTGFTMRGPSACPECKGQKVKGRLFDLLEKQSVFIDCQEIRIQERPEELPPGQLPRYMDGKLYDDLVDKARPGDRVTMTGTIRAEQELAARRGRLRTFELFIETNHVDVVGREDILVEITPEEERMIREIARDPWSNNKIIRSIAPSIYGYEDIKEAILYLLVGGVRKTLPDGVVIRGEVNVLLVGDPGIAKSQMLQYAARVAPRGIYTSGRGSTAAGLTAAVLREKSGGMVLEAGALVLADKGICSIDEVEKMREEDRVAIHEALEQNTVSVAKGGIVATLNARTSVLAAANPALGRYDPYQTISQNITLPITLLSRFDLIFIMRDMPEPERDSKVSEHILMLHKERSTGESPPIPPDLLKKYISYAKRVNPAMSEEAMKELKDFYLKMRAASGPDAAISITPRQLEALIRLAEARARVGLRDTISVEDARQVIRLMTVCLESVGVDTRTGKVDIDVIMTGKPRSLRERMQIVLTKITEIEKRSGYVEEKELYEALDQEKLMEQGEARAVVAQLIREGLIYAPKPGTIRRTAV